MNIVIATDLSDHAASPLRWGVDFARQHNASLHVIHVVDHASDKELWSALFETPAELKQHLLEQVKQHTRAFLSGHAPDLQVADIHVAVGQPAEQIARYAERNNAALIVSGTSGRGRIQQAILGSTAYRLPHETRIPMAFVPDDAPSPPVARAVIAVDLSRTSDEVLAWTAKHLQGAEVTAVYSAGLTRISAMVTPTPAHMQTVREFTASQVAKIEAALQQHGIKATVVVEYDDAAAAILNVARAKDADLIVMGSRGLGAFERFVLGSVTTKVLSHTNTAVIALRDLDS